MMYERKKFSVHLGTDAYRDNFDKVFAKKPEPLDVEFIDASPADLKQALAKPKEYGLLRASERAVAVDDLAALLECAEGVAAEYDSDRLRDIIERLRPLLP